MTVRLTHRAAPALQHRTLSALTGLFSLTGVAASLRTTRLMPVPDKIPYLLTGQSVALSKKPPVWSSAPTYSITAGQASGPTAIPVSVPDGGSPIITVTWSATGTPATQPSWVTLNSGTSPTISFSGAQTDGDDISGMVLSAVANGQSAVLSSAGSITVNAAGGVDADWIARSTAAGVFFAENFDYADLTAFANHANNPCYYGHSAGGGTTPPSNLYSLITDPSIALSGKAMRIIRPAQAGASTTSMQYSWDTNNGPGVPFTPASLHQNYYFQFIVHGDLVFNWPWTQDSQTHWATPKLMQLGRHDSSTIKGEIVFVNPNVRRCVTTYMRDDNANNTYYFSRTRSTVFNGSDTQWQPSIDNTAITNPTTATQYRNKYGVFEYDQDYAGNTFAPSDYQPIGASTRLEQFQPWLTAYNESHTANAGVPWVKNGRTVVTIQRQTTPSPRIRAWAGPYGIAQRLIFDTDANHWRNGTSLNWITTLTNPASDVGAGFQMSLYVTGDSGEGGANRPDMWVDYIELIASTNPINSPGGFALPGVAVTALEQEVNAMSAPGTWRNVTSALGSGGIGFLAALCTTSGSPPHIFTYTNAGSFSPFDKKIHFMGNPHGGSAMWHSWYDETANTWTRGADPFGPGHGYDHYVADQVNGDLYSMRYASNDLWRRTQAGTWSNRSTLPAMSYRCDSRGSAWWTGSLTGATSSRGTLVIFNAGCESAPGGNVHFYDPVANAWQPSGTTGFQNTNVGGQTDGGNLAYSLVYNCCIGAGWSGEYRRIWRINSDRTVTELSRGDSVSPAFWVGIQAGLLTCDPESGKFLVLTRFSGNSNGSYAFWELVPTGSGTYTKLPNAPSSIYVDNSIESRGTCVVEIPKHGAMAWGVTMWVTMTDQTTGQIYLYRHA